jgi:hypothetical protein
VLPATLAQRLGLPELLRQHVHLGQVAGAANPDVKALTAVASLLAGGEYVDDVNALRAGRVGAEILGVAPAAASTWAPSCVRSRQTMLDSWTRSRRTSTNEPGRREPGPGGGS